MSAPTVTAPQYANLAETRRLLGVGIDGARDAVLERIALGVTDTISRLLGVTWDGQQPATVLREFLVDGSGVITFPVPALIVSGVTWAGDLASPSEFAPAFFDGDRGWYLGLIVRTYAALGSTIVVQGVWADRPGGQPPDMVTVFASWATAQLWRRQSAGHSGEIGPEGYRTVTDDPWKSQDWKNIVSVHRVRRTGTV